MSTEEIIARCTRDGFTSWFNVAQQLGLSVDQARSRHDPNYGRPNPFAERQAQKIDDLIIDLDSHKSPHVKGPLLRVRVLTYLAKLPGTREDVALRLAITGDTAKFMLTTLKSEGLVTHDGVARGRVTWSLSAAGAIYAKGLSQRSAA